MYCCLVYYNHNQTTSHLFKMKIQPRLKSFSSAQQIQANSSAPLLSFRPFTSCTRILFSDPKFADTTAEVSGQTRREFKQLRGVCNLLS